MQKMTRMRRFWQSVSLVRYEKFQLVTKLGQADPTQRICAIIMACPLSCDVVTCWVMSTQKSLFNIVQPSTLSKPEKRIPDSSPLSDFQAEERLLTD